jgi:hypothetical protein
MGKVYEQISEEQREFIQAQPMFFVATAPSGPDGHVNLSPKGYPGSFVILGPNRVGYADYTGSGIETVAHLRDNGRITVMFVAFEGPPNILRLYGHGTVVLPDDRKFAALAPHFREPFERGVRALIDIDVHRVSDSCGFSVPFMDYIGPRDLLRQWTDHRGDADLDEYRERKNSCSIDGLPALADAPAVAAPALPETADAEPAVAAPAA